MKLQFLIVLLHALTYDVAGGEKLNVNSIRLVNGTQPYSGRVEININGVWGTVCDDSFDYNDANVMCRMIGLKATRFESGAYYGPGIGPIFAQNFKCKGYETHLKDCEFVPNVQCTHDRDISIICTECGQLEIHNGDMQSISADGRNIDIKCKEGFQSNVTTSTCENGTWSVPSLLCTAAVTNIRLVNGIGLYDGRVEVLMNGTWGTICGTSFSFYEAGTICKILFDTWSYRTYSSSSSNYGPGTGPVHIDNLDCKTYETNLDACQYSLDVSLSCADHSRDIFVACNVLSIKSVTSTRLVNGTGPFDGRMELYVDGNWGTIDRRYIDMYDARTLCNTHNASLAMYFTSAIYGQGTGPVILHQLNCYSERDHMSSCSRYSPYRPSSSHAYDLSIACTPCGLPPIYNGDPILFNGSELTMACHKGYQPGQVTVKCLDDNSWSQDQKCTPTFVYPPEIEDIALRNGYLPTEGRVEIKINGTWGTVCDTGFDSADAQVICNMFGLQYERLYLKSSHSSGRGSGPIYVSNMTCNGNESHINGCSYDISNICTHYDDVAVRCTGYHLNITGVRLAGTDGPYHGRIEIKVNETWGTICHSGFGSSEARFICRLLGLEYRRYFYSAYYGQGSGPIYINRLDCSSYYTSFDQCQYSIDYFYSCDHNSDMSVMCYGPTLNITDARLVNGTSLSDGRAEIKVNDTWGTICDANFDIHAADLFCRLIGLRAAQYFTGAFYGEGSGPVFIDQLFCESYDYTLSDCRYLFLNECSHASDISVVCNECGQPDIFFWGVDFFTYNDTSLFADCSYYKTYVGKLKLTCNNQTQEWVTEGECQEYNFPLDITGVRLVDGPNTTAGRVEIRSLDTWGTICDDAFGIEEANVICRMLGYAPAMRYFASSHFGAGNGPIFIDDLSCQADAIHLNNCTYETYDNCNHDDDIAVVCTDCGDPTPINGFTNSTETYYGAEVHVSCDKDYMLDGNSDIKCQINGEWTNKPSCKLIDCGDPTPDNGKVNTTETTNGTVALISCDNGYTLSGQAVIACQSNGTWTQNPACDIVDCKVPKPNFANVTLIGNKTTFGESASISCWTGYSQKVNSNVMCLSNGTWEKWAECKIVDCGNPVPDKGFANSTNTTYNTVLEITCESGYNLTGSSVIKCQENETWTDYPVCDTSDCGQFAVVNGEVNTSLGTSIGSLATVRCDDGYDLQGSSEIICTTTGWNETVSCQIQVCDDPSPDNGKITDTDGEDEFVFGNYVKIECNTGYSIEGDSVITCIHGGNWSASPKCRLIVCEKHNVPLHGTMDDSAGNEYNSAVAFSCNEGYLLVGEKTSTCGDDGDWSSEPPTCEKKSDVGGPCLSKEYCLMADSLCINSVCKCLTGIFDSKSKICDKMPLLPYGTDEGDHFISDTEVCGPDISFLPGMPVSGSMRKHLFVCSYGFVSFDNKYTNPTPPENTNSIVTNGKETIIAPFYGPIDKRTSGPVYFRSYDILNSYDKMKGDKELISYIENIVIKFGNRETFDASFVMIATWHEARTTVAGFDSTKKSTFQAVLVSDGKSTYVFYIYGHGLMNWRPNDSEFTSNVPIWVGHNVQNVDSGLSFSHPYSFTSQALQLDSQPEVSSTEDDVAGLVFKPLHQLDMNHQNDAVDCINWYNANYDNKKNLDYIASLMPECPCDIWLSRFDPWFWRIGLQRWRRDVNHICVDMLHAGNFRQYGKSCCYDVKTWLWVYERPFAGGFQLYHPRYPLQHILNDVIYKTKCCVASNHCNLFYELRPTGSCYASSPYDFGTFWGDPHFITLDRKNFTFNGLGEYTLLHVDTDNFTLDIQARTERALKKDGKLSDATVFSAFAVKESSNASLHVELNKAKTGMFIYANKADITSQFYASTDPENPFVYIPEEEPSGGGTLIISKRDDSLSVLFPTSGISLNISVSVEMLSLNTGVPKVLQGLTTGLLGNYDGNPENDFTMPNGTVLRGNLTEREVFEYGKTWSINPNESAFIYEVGKTHFDFHNDSYIPRFLDEADPDKILEAEKACNGSQNIECIFDLVFTEKMEIANQTNIIRGESDSTTAELEITVPSLIGCEDIYATKGQNVNCRINFDSGDEVYFLENSVDAKINISTASVTYFQNTDDPVKVRIATKNKNGRSSPSFVLNIVLCTLCNGHGVCSNEAREDKFDSDHFKYAKCICEPEYQGDDCENDFDGCAANPCSLQRTCQSLTADEQKKQNRTYTCGPCPTGYRTDTENECKDVDECVDNEDICDQVCTNTEGSFECSCRSGFKVDSENKSKCKDINECDVALHNCTHECVNNEGGFSCQCFTGFKFDSSTWTCKETSDEGICNDTEKIACTGSSGCRNIDGIPECFCTDGFELDQTKTVCKDIDECNRGVCQHDCVNTNGSFECVCFTGYKLYGSTTCKACAIPYWGENCANKCVCTGRGADRCDPVKGCICKPGWQGEKCDNDINECLETVDQCDDPLKTCVNSLGSYTCSCRSGYQLTDEQKCEDIDECTDPQLNDCEQNCTNTVGSYSCKCRDGYTRLNGTSCTDVDECALGLDKCEQRCINNPGFYSCFCHFGYSLNDDRRTCAKLSDPCLSINNLTCSHFCVLASEDASCACMKGFNLDPDNETCSDINECDSEAGNKCHTNATCTNTAGSYNCECPVGTQLENDGRTCSECDDYHYGKNCVHECSCLNGYCNKIKGCVCQHGWVGDKCDIDINECETGQIYCAAQNTMCVNLLGSATCLCQTGYENSTGKCLDIDECSDLLLNSCDQQCMNTNGSFTCSCHKGFQLKNGKCTDVNECTSKHGCGQICENTVGSYLCSCNEGFKLQLSDRKTCRPETECNKDENNTCTAHASCYVNNGTVSCTCSKGFQLSGNSCEDVDECMSSVQPCDQLCSNNAGSFVCSCKTGFQLQEDKITCKECEAWKYGINCQSDCTCDESNSERCDHATGTCVCKSGWEGINCEDDVDECLNDAACPTKSACMNSDGSYVCECNDGYVKTGAKRCEECDSRHYGEDCARECTCNIENTEDCNHETGSCTCNQGWQGLDCVEDVNECSSNSSICDFKANSVCQNNIGSYKCICKDGFLEQNGICIDFNECLANETNTCEQKCLNLPGSYECACFSGFHMSGGVCQDIDECKKNNTCDQNCNNTYGSFICSCETGFYLNVTDPTSCVACEEWTYGFECGHNCSCNVPNSERCDSKTGDCICAKEWNGSECTEDVDECVDEGICQENSYCENSNGSFDCLCEIGYQLTNGNTCKECDNPYYGKNCSKVCDCIPEGTLECNHVNGSCTCSQGWTGVLCNVDIDECEENKTICEYKDNSTCNNENGSYKCLCNGGLRDEDDICTECDIWKFGANCESVCSCDTTNTEHCNPVTGLCRCKPGWRGTTCKDDVNECEIDDICQSNSTCKNTVGSFGCDCNTGYIEANKGVCSECSSWFFGDNCSKECSCNKDNSDMCDHVTGNCTCSKGWAGDKCEIDVDECFNNDSICDEKANSTCNNGIGSYSCVCNTGFKDDESNKCEECSSWFFGDNCSKECSCNKDNTDMCDHVTGKCTCSKGWAGDKCEIDVDECFNNDSICDEKANSTCNNGIGSYSCVCNTGFKDDESNKCEECSSWFFGDNCSKECSCNKDNTDICDHVTGKCTCSKGWAGDKCEKDVDECFNNDSLCDEKANSTCNNMAGSYSCVCNTGFKDDGSNKCEECSNWYFGNKCSTECTCNKDNTDTCDHVNGACSCLKAWTGENCTIDVNECLKNDSLCDGKANSICNNTIGSYSCLCNIGFKDNGNKCEECSNWYYGNECSSECTCNKDNTDTCDHVTSDCTCFKEWAGENCDIDVDECLNNKTLCDIKAHSTCNNTIGSYNCVCDTGFVDDGKNKCEECNSWQFGHNCSMDCACNKDNTDICNHVTGDCTCLKEWTGENCTVDVDECLTNSSLCDGKTNSTCNNTIGSYMCICNTGFQDIENNKCEECIGNTYGKNCSEMCGCNITNSLNENQTCDIMTGQCKCKAGWYGDSCNDDVNECEDIRSCSTINDTTCVNTFGSFLCDCLRGFTKSSDGACIIESSTTTAPLPGNSFKHSLTLDFDLPADTNLQAADTYNAIKNEILSTLLNFYKTYMTGLIDIIINDIRNGSIIVDYTVVYGDHNEDDAANLTKAVLNLEQGTQLTVYGQNVSVTSAMYKDLKPCELYNATVGSCKQGYQCRVENNIPICRLEYEDNEVNWSIIIGLSVAGIFVIIMVAIAIVFVRHLSRKHKMRKQDIRRSRRAAYYRDTHGNVSDMDKVHQWQKGLASDTFPKRWTPRNWRDLLTGPAMFRHGENESAYSQPYYGSHARPTYSIDDKMTTGSRY